MLSDYQKVADEYLKLWLRWLTGNKIPRQKNIETRKVDMGGVKDENGRRLRTNIMDRFFYLKIKVKKQN